MMIKKVLETIKKYNIIEEGENLVVGISGGPDSVCLLHVLYSIASDLDINIYAVHINHMLRGEEAKRDEQYVSELCKKLGINLISRAFDITRISREKGISLEEAGREVRYEQFEEVVQKMGGGKIAVAHNRNDQAETVLMHILRGTGLDGLKGMDYKRGNIIRPLLDIDRKDIEKYCIENKLNPIIDSSNLSNVYTRNKIRLDLIPFIDRSFETDSIERILKMSALIRDDFNFIDEFSLKSYKESLVKAEKDSVWLDIKQMKKFDFSIRKRIVRNALKTVKGDLKGIENVHIDNIEDLIINGRTGSKIHLPCNIRVEKSYDVIKIHINLVENKISEFNLDLEIPGNTNIESVGASINASLEEKIPHIHVINNLDSNSLVQYFDYEKLKEGINIRNRKEGDIFKPFKSNGTKKLKEYFIDNKIPRDIRNQIPLVTKCNEVVWIIGYKISDKFRVTENTKIVLNLKYIKQIKN